MGSYMEDPVVGFHQMLNDPGILLWSCIIICSILFFNLNGLVLTKHVSCMFRAFWDATRTVSVWMVSLLVGLETFELRSFLIQLAGFTLLVLGNFTYNEILEWKIGGINSHMSKYLDADGNLIKSKSNKVSSKNVDA